MADYRRSIWTIDPDWPRETDAPFHAAAGGLKDFWGDSFPRLAERCAHLAGTQDGFGKTNLAAYFRPPGSRWGNAAPPTPDALKVLAQALGVTPMYFREYRQHIAAQRARDLVEAIGLDEVMQALDALDKQPSRRH